MVGIKIGTGIIPVLPDRFVGFGVKLGDERMGMRVSGVHPVSKKHDIAVGQLLTIVLVTPTVIATFPFEFFLSAYQ